MKYSEKLKNSLQYLFFLFPFLLISGPLLSDLMISFIAIFFLFKIVKKNEYNSLKNNIVYFFIIFYVYININSFFSYKPLISFQTSLPYIRFILFAFFLSYYLNLNYNLKKIIIISFFSSYVILLFDSLLQLMTGANLLGDPIINDRISSLFGDKLILGSFVSRTIPLVIGLLFLLKFRLRYFVQILIFLIGGVLVYLSAERLSFAYLIVTFFCFLFFTTKKKNIYYLVLGIVLFFLFLNLIKPSSMNRLVNHTARQIVEKNYSIFSYRHELHYTTAYKIFKENIFFGAGLKSFRLLCDQQKFIPLEKILSDNIYKSPIDGFVYINENLPNYKYSIIISKTPINLSDNKITNFNNIDLFNYLIGNEIHLIKFYKKNGDFVKKNEPIVSDYQYTNGCNTHPHNIFMQFISELGVVGIIFYLLALFFLFSKLFLLIFSKIKNKNLADYQYFNFFILIGIFLSIFPLFPSGNFFNNWLSIIFYSYVGLFLKYSNKEILQ